MSTAPGVIAPARLPMRQALGSARLHPSDFLLPAALGLWAVGVSRTDTAALGPYGLPGVLPVVFYAGVAVLVVSAGLELARPRPSPPRLALHAVALVIMLFATAPLVYPQGRYAWLYKTAGVVQFISAHGQLNRHIDIYQNWPGFFALAAWLGKVAGVASPLSYAKWAQPVFELAALPLLYLAYDAAGLTSRQRWLALLLYPAANWIGQDYFSPQALGTLLSLAILAIAPRWLSPANTRRRAGRHAAGPAKAEGPARGAPGARHRAACCAAIVLLYCVLTCTHELSPYIVALQLGALALAGLLRPRWLPILLGAIAVGYLVPRFGYVNQHYGLLNSIGSFFRNAAPPSVHAGSASGSEQLIRHCAAALSLGMWGLAAAGAWLRRRSGRPVAALVLLTFSPVVVLAAQSYGNEGILRVYLFSLPWAAALAAAALAPTAGTESASGGPEDGRAGGRARLARRPWGVLRAPLAIGVVLALFFPAFFGDDYYNMMTSAEVRTVTAFLRAARPGPIFIALPNAPMADTARYNLFPLPTIFGTGGVAAAAPLAPGIAGVIARDALTFTHGLRPAYVLVTPSMRAYNVALGLVPRASFAHLLAALGRSPDWELLVRRAGTAIYELPPGAPQAAIP
jgi:hypothetical protein